MRVKINCQYNDSGPWCTNKKVKKSLFGFGARCCPEYYNQKKYQYKVENSNIKPQPKPGLSLTESLIPQNKYKYQINDITWVRKYVLNKMKNESCPAFYELDLYKKGRWDTLHELALEEERREYEKN